MKIPILNIHITRKDWEECCYHAEEQAKHYRRQAELNDKAYDMLKESTDYAWENFKEQYKQQETSLNKKRQLLIEWCERYEELEKKYDHAKYELKKLLASTNPYTYIEAGKTIYIVDVANHEITHSLKGRNKKEQAELIINHLLNTYKKELELLAKPNK